MSRGFAFPGNPLCPRFLLPCAGPSGCRPNCIACGTSNVEARSHGDLSENAEYDAARERQGFIESRIGELDGILSNAQLIDPSTLNADGRAVFGSTVEIEDQESGERVTYQIVGDAEADIRSNLISVSSPVARALIGKSEGDVVQVKAPSGVREFEIVSVKYC